MSACTRPSAAKTELDSSRAVLERAIADEASARANVNDAQAALSTDQINDTAHARQNPQVGLCRG